MDSNNDDRKPIPYRALKLVREVIKHGEAKYGDNWMRQDMVAMTDEYCDHAVAHVGLHRADYKYRDKDSGLPNLAHAAARLLLLLEREEKDAGR